MEDRLQSAPLYFYYKKLVLLNINSVGLCSPLRPKNQALESELGSQPSIGVWYFIGEFMGSLYQRFKVRFNWFLDRILDFCDLTLMEVYQPPKPFRRMAPSFVRWVGDVSLFLRDFPRLPVSEYITKDCRIIFVGGQDNRSEVCKTLLGGQAERRDLGRVALWNLPRQSQVWLDSGVELVVCELSQLCPWQPKGVITFSVPVWIKMTLQMPEVLTDLLCGNQRKRVRQRIHKGLEAGFEYHFSREKSDFDVFHYQMYQPFIKARYGEGAAISTYEHQWKRWFEPGGLLVVTQEGKAIAGALCYCADSICYSIEGGVLEGDPVLLKQEINSMIDWYAMTWAHQRGLRQFDMGGTRSRRSDGVYLYKRQWGAQVRRRKKIYPVWTFATRKLTEDLRERLNKIGYISEVGDQFYGVYIQAEDEMIDEKALTGLRDAWKHEPLAGILVVSPGGGFQTYSLTAE